MESIRKSIEVEAPIKKVYNQWTQFEQFPRFMEGVERVIQVDDKYLHWVAEVGGKTKEWDAEIVDQVPEERISWRSTSGVRNSGVVKFRSLGPSRTEVGLEIFYEPEGALEKTGDALGLLSRRVQGDLERFRDFIEVQRSETGAWRGEIRAGEVKPADRSDNESARAARAASSAAPEYDNSGKSGLS